MSSEPDRLYIEEEDKEKIYDKVLDEKDSPLYRENGIENKDVFILAMCLGFEAGSRTILTKRLGYFLSKNLSAEDMAVMYSIAVEVEGLEALADKKKLFEIAEQFAAGGIHILYDRIFTGEFGTFAKHLENQLLKKFRELYDETDHTIS